jgi:hypothetical protein
MGHVYASLKGIQLHPGFLTCIYFLVCTEDTVFDPIAQAIRSPQGLKHLWLMGNLVPVMAQSASHPLAHLASGSW